MQISVPEGIQIKHAQQHCRRRPRMLGGLASGCFGDYTVNLILAPYPLSISDLPPRDRHLPRGHVVVRARARVMLSKTKASDNNSGNWGKQGGWGASKTTNQETTTQEQQDEEET